MTSRTRMRTAIATVIAVASIAVYPMILILAWTSDGGLPIFAAATASLVLVGLLLVVRAPENGIGPVLVLAGALLALARTCNVYGLTGGNARPAWPGSELASVLGEALIAYPIALALIVIPLIFPDGRLLSRRWRLVVWLVVAALAASTASGLALKPFADSVGRFVSAALVIGFGAAVAALCVRYQRGDPIERQQLKWLVAVAALGAIFFPIGFLVPITEITFVAWLLGSLTLVAVPLAIAVAVLRYHLFEIDRIISRTLAYGIVIGLLGAVFVGIMLVLQAEVADLTGNGGIAVAISTLAVFALFQPVLRRVRRAVDRRFDRARYDGERTAGAFAERLRWETDMELVTGDLRATVEGAMAPKGLTIWLRPRHDLR